MKNQQPKNQYCPAIHQGTFKWTYLDPYLDPHHPRLQNRTELNQVEERKKTTIKPIKDQIIVLLDRDKGNHSSTVYNSVHNCCRNQNQLAQFLEANNHLIPISDYVLIITLNLIKMYCSMQLKGQLIWLLVNLIYHHVNSAQPSETTQHPCLPPSADPSMSSEAAATAEYRVKTHSWHSNTDPAFILQLFFFFFLLQVYIS